eukprot:ctg_277.g121
MRHGYYRHPPRVAPLAAPQTAPLAHIAKWPPRSPRPAPAAWSETRCGDRIAPPAPVRFYSLLLSAIDALPKSSKTPSLTTSCDALDPCNTRPKERSGSARPSVSLTICLISDLLFAHRESPRCFSPSTGRWCGTGQRKCTQLAGEGAPRNAKEREDERVCGCTGHGSSAVFFSRRGGGAGVAWWGAGAGGRAAAGRVARQGGNQRERRRGRGGGSDTGSEWDDSDGGGGEDEAVVFDLVPDAGGRFHTVRYGERERVEAMADAPVLEMGALRLGAGGMRRERPRPPPIRTGQGALPPDESIILPPIVSAAALASATSSTSTTTTTTNSTLTGAPGSGRSGVSPVPRSPWPPAAAA